MSRRPAPPRALFVLLALSALLVASSLAVGDGGPVGRTVPSPPAGPSGLAPCRVATPSESPMLPAAPPAPGAGEGRLVVNSSDPTLVPNDGLRTNITVFPYSHLAGDASFQVGASEGIGSYTAVFGFFENPARLLTPFFTVFNRTNAVADLVYWDGYILQNGSGYDFELERTTGTLWQLTVNGELFKDNATLASFDFGTTEATNASTLQFSEIAIYSTTSPVPSDLWIPLALAVHRAGAWRLPSSGRAYLSLSGVPGWGVQGRLQRSILAPDELESGQTIAVPAQGAALWSEAQVAVAVGLTVPPNPVIATTSASVSVRVGVPGGPGLPNVAVWLIDPLAGSFQPQSLITNATGLAVAGWIAPNVSSAVADPLEALVTILGYNGSATAAASVLPATQVVLRLQGAPAQLVPAQSTVITVVAESTAGAVLPGIGLSFVVSGSAYTPTSDAVTDANGLAQVTVIADPAGPSAVLRATVTSPGAWGKMSWNFTLGKPASPPWWTSPWLVVGIVAGAAAAIAAFAGHRYRRRPGAELPPLALARQPRRSRPAGTTDPVPPPNPIRRPP